MSPDDRTMLAFVDGTLSPAQRAEMEAAVAASPELSDTVAALRASILPYAAAFDAQPLPPLPEGLTHSLHNLVRVVRADNAEQPSAWATHLVGQPERRRRTRWPGAMRYAAVFAAGALCWAMLSSPGGGLVGLQNAAGGSPLVRSVAEYHALYARETVAGLATNDPQNQALINRLWHEQGLAVQVPDLRSLGLAFKRVQRLRFKDQVLIQIVYLPDQGAPLALCLIADSGPASAPHREQVGEVQAVSWRQSRLTHVLVATDTSLDTLQLAQHLAAGRLPTLLQPL